jgi:hypothetical protein
VDIERATLVERATRIALVAGLGTRWVKAVDSLGEDAGAGGFTNASRTAKEVGVSQLVTLDCIFQRRGNMLLTNNRSEGCRAVFAGRYYELFHNCDKITNKLLKYCFLRSKIDSKTE